MHKTLISGLFLHPQKVGGTEHYFYNILDGLYQNGENKNTSLILNESYKNVYEGIVQQFDSRYISLKQSRVLQDYMLHNIASLKDFETVFEPNYITPLSAINLKKIKPQFVTTIHDLQYFHYPEFFSLYNKTLLYTAHQFTLNFADKVVCISEFVKDDILKRFGQKHKDKLVVIPNAVSFGRFEHRADISSHIQLNEPFILSVSAMWAHKNTLTLVKAFKEFAKTNKDVKLVLTGQLPENLLSAKNQYTQKLVDELKNSERIITTGYVSNEVLGELYRQCSLFAFPSLFEGFGMPVVEAMGFGKPVITTRNTSLAEVTQGKAIYLNDPLNHSELTSLLHESLRNIDQLNNKFRSYAEEIRSFYSPKNIGVKYIQLFYS